MSWLLSMLTLTSSPGWDMSFFSDSTDLQHCLSALNSRLLPEATNFLLQERISVQRNLPELCLQPRKYVLRFRNLITADCDWDWAKCVKTDKTWLKTVSPVRTRARTVLRVNHQEDKMHLLGIYWLRKSMSLMFSTWLLQIDGSFNLDMSSITCFCGDCWWSRKSQGFFITIITESQTLKKNQRWRIECTLWCNHPKGYIPSSQGSMFQSSLVILRIKWWLMVSFLTITASTTARPAPPCQQEGLATHADVSSMCSLEERSICLVVFDF